MGERAQRASFRWAGRRVLRRASDPATHEARVSVACKLQGSEAVQGALADMAYVGAAMRPYLMNMLYKPAVSDRLARFTLWAFLDQVHSGTALPRVTRLATRYSILTIPSLDVPTRAIRCGVDDSHRLAANAIPRLLSGDAAAEEAFLVYCEGALDTLAFMLARSALIKARKRLSPRWHVVSDALQRGIGHV